VTLPRQRIAILGGGPGGYEAALVAAQLGADVTIVDSDGLGGACVLTDCVPSKTLIETSNAMTMLNRSPSLGIATGGLATVNAARLYERITDLARAQSRDITERVAAEGIKVIAAHGRLTASGTVMAGDQEIAADAILVATGALPRILPGAEPDGERILTWRQLYDLTEVPRDLIVVGSGVTGAGVRVRLPGARLAGHARLLAGPGAAAGRRGRGQPDRGRVPPQRHDRARPLPRAIRPP
jgi:pyruvate/2-oxoglutarate dehydrogenase complex dihydrolipoamide dehydrogenase (E3) component